jgi:hypothetical protein
MGRLKKPWFRVARLKYWYWPVAKIRGKEPDYGLDIEFAYRKPLPSGGGQYRRRVFEWIRKTGREPQGGHPNLRSIEEIIKAVDVHPDFRGTAACYYSRFWELFLLATMTADDICERIDHFFEEHFLERRSPKEIEGYRSGGFASRFSAQYDQLLSMALSDIDDLSAGYFVCLLELERDVSGRVFGMLDYLKPENKYLKRFFTQHIQLAGEENYAKAIKYVRAIKVERNPAPSVDVQERWRALTWPICKVGNMPTLKANHINKIITID